jgi:hypothetical protein
MPDSLDPVLLHVRKAYRLLNAYHGKILSTIPKIAEPFGKEFLRWEAYHQYKGFAANKAIFNNYLGLMPLQLASFLYRPVGKLPMPGEWLLDVHHVGDSALDEVDDDDYDPASLPEPDKAVTRIELYAFLVVEGGGGDWYGLWDNSGYPAGDEPEHDLEIGGEKVWQGTSAGCMVWAFGREWSVADFANEALLTARCREFHGLVDRMAAAALSR